jgi:hypothetical protein
MRHHLIMIALLGSTTLGASAQSTPAAPASPAAASAPSAPASPAKKALIQRVLTLQQPALENTAREVAERPAMQLTNAAQQYLQQRVPADKREAMWGQVQTAVRKYLAEAVPLVKERALALSQTTLAGMLDERFTEDELKQLAATLENPAFKKFQQAMPEISDKFVQKLVADAGASVDPKLKALDTSISTALGVPSAGAAASAPAAGPRAAKPAAPAASKAGGK